MPAETGTGGSGGSGSGGTAPTGTGTVGSGGSDSDACSGRYPGNPNCGGAGGPLPTGGAGGTLPTGGAGGTLPTGGAGGILVTGGTGGTVATGGSGPASGGTGGTRATGATGGNGGTGGTRAIGTGGSNASGGTMGGGGNPGACTCNPGAISTTTLDCFCSRYGCVDGLASYTTGGDAGARYDTLAVYQDCGLAVAQTITSIRTDVFVFDLDTGKLVGASFTSDATEVCPWLGDVGFRTLRAGTFPDPTCTLSRCTNRTLPLVQPCPDAGM